MKIKVYIYIYINFLWIVTACNQRSQIPTPKSDPYLSYYVSFQNIAQPSDSLKIINYDGRTLRITYKKSGLPIPFAISKTKDCTYIDRNVRVKIFSGWLDTTAVAGQWSGTSFDFDTLRPGIQNFMTVQSTILGVSRKAMLGLKFDRGAGDSIYFK